MLLFCFERGAGRGGRPNWAETEAERYLCLYEAVEGPRVSGREAAAELTMTTIDPTA